MIFSTCKIAFAGSEEACSLLGILTAQLNHDALDYLELENSLSDEMWNYWIWLSSALDKQGEICTSGLTIGSHNSQKDLLQFHLHTFLPASFWISKFSIVSQSIREFSAWSIWLNNLALICSSADQPMIGTAESPGCQSNLHLCMYTAAD